MLLLALVAAGSVTIPPAHITLAFAPGRQVTPGMVRAALTEAAAIWSPYQVVVTRAAAPVPPCPGDLALSVVVSTEPSLSEAPWQGPLGSVEFDGDGVPGRVITVFVDRLTGMLENAHLGHVPASQWPQIVRDLVVGRALGRVIAHEIGHVVTRSASHTARGLMRAIQRSDELIEPTRQRYHLTE